MVSLVNNSLEVYHINTPDHAAPSVVAVSIVASSSSSKKKQIESGNEIEEKKDKAGKKKDKKKSEDEEKKEVEGDAVNDEGGDDEEDPDVEVENETEDAVVTELIKSSRGELVLKQAVIDLHGHRSVRARTCTVPYTCPSFSLLFHSLVCPSSSSLNFCKSFSLNFISLGNLSLSYEWTVPTIASLASTSSSSHPPSLNVRSTNPVLSVCTFEQSAYRLLFFVFIFHSTGIPLTSIDLFFSDLLLSYRLYSTFFLSSLLFSTLHFNFFSSSFFSLLPSFSFLSSHLIFSYSFSLLRSSYLISPPFLSPSRQIGCARCVPLC